MPKQLKKSPGQVAKSYRDRLNTTPGVVALPRNAVAPKRVTKHALNVRLCEVEEQRDRVESELRRSVEERMKLHTEFSALERELRVANRDLLESKMELAWIARFAIAKAINSPETFAGYAIRQHDGKALARETLTDCATTETPRRAR